MTVWDVPGRQSTPLHQPFLPASPPAGSTADIVFNRGGGRGVWVGQMYGEYAPRQMLGMNEIQRQQDLERRNWFKPGDLAKLRAATRASLGR